MWVLPVRADDSQTRKKMDDATKSVGGLNRAKIPTLDCSQGFQFLICVFKLRKRNVEATTLMKA